MAKGGKRDGAGRPVGSISQVTKEKRAAEAELHARIVKAVHRLFNSQLALAEGVTMVFRIDEVGTGKDKRREHVLVTDTEEIKQVLDENEGGDGTVDDNYYYITTKAPDNKAIDSMLDRAFGKAAINQPLGDDGEPLPPMLMNVVNLPVDELLKLLTAASANHAQRGGPAKASRRN